MADWNKRFIELAKHIATWSKDRSTQVGAVIADSNNRILSVGYNGFPTGCDDTVEYRHQRPAKYMYTEHAERNAIYSAARSGINILGSTIYLMWYPCSDCARAIIQSGIKKVVCLKPNEDNQYWGDHFKVAKELFEECDIDITVVEQ